MVHPARKDLWSASPAAGSRMAWRRPAVQAFAQATQRSRERKPASALRNPVRILSLVARLAGGAHPHQHRGNRQERRPCSNV